MTAGRLQIRVRVWAALLTLAVALSGAALAGCASTPNPDASLASSVLAALPMPPSATMTVGAQGPGVDGDARFYAFSSTASPAAERNAYDAALRAAAYEPVQRAGTWTAYRHADVTVWVSVSNDGPPTSIVALVAADPTSAALPPRLVADPSAVALLAVTPGRLPATPEPVARPTPSPAPTDAPTAAPTDAPTAAPATSSPTPAASPDPTAKPKPSHNPKPSHQPKPTPKPRPTPQPKPSHPAASGSSSQ